MMVFMVVRVDRSVGSSMSRKALRCTSSGREMRKTGVRGAAASAVMPVRSQHSFFVSHVGYSCHFEKSKLCSARITPRWGSQHKS